MKKVFKLSVFFLFFLMIIILGYVCFKYLDKEITVARFFKKGDEMVNNLDCKSCNSDCENVENNYVKKTEESTIDINSYEDQNNIIEKEKIIKKYPTEVTYPNDYGPPWPDNELKYININGEKLSITSDGKVNKSNGSLFFNLGNAYAIERLFFYMKKDYVIAIYAENNGGHGGGVEVKRISTNTNKTIWSTSIGGFNLGVPVIVDNNLYISAIGFIGKLNLDTGEYIWKFEDLYENGKYNSFNEPIFSEDKVIFSDSIGIYDQINTIVIYDKIGQIIRKD